MAAGGGRQGGGRVVFAVVSLFTLPKASATLAAPSPHPPPAAPPSRGAAAASPRRRGRTRRSRARLVRVEARRRPERVALRLDAPDKGAVEFAAAVAAGRRPRSRGGRRGVAAPHLFARFARGERERQAPPPSTFPPGSPQRSSWCLDLRWRRRTRASPPPPATSSTPAPVLVRVAPPGGGLAAVGDALSSQSALLLPTASACAERRPEREEEGQCSSRRGCRGCGAGGGLAEGGGGRGDVEGLVGTLGAARRAPRRPHETKPTLWARQRPWTTPPGRVLTRLRPRRVEACAASPRSASSARAAVCRVLDPAPDAPAVRVLNQGKSGGALEGGEEGRSGKRERHRKPASADGRRRRRPAVSCRPAARADGMS